MSKFKLPETPRLAIDAVIILKHQRLVLIERKFPPLGFALPGGFVDVGESVEDAVHREVFEETNLLSTELRLIGVFSEPDRDPRGHIVSLAYAMLGVGNLKAKDDAKAVHSISVTDALGLELVDDHKKILIAAVQAGYISGWLHLRR